MSNDYFILFLNLCVKTLATLNVKQREYTFLDAFITFFPTIPLLILQIILEYENIKCTRIKRAI